MEGSDVFKIMDDGDDELCYLKWNPEFLHPIASSVLHMGVPLVHNRWLNSALVLDLV